jgi:hypothetical protein
MSDSDEKTTAALAISVSGDGGWTVRPRFSREMPGKLCVGKYGG